MSWFVKENSFCTSLSDRRHNFLSIESTFLSIYIKGEQVRMDHIDSQPAIDEAQTYMNLHAICSPKSLYAMNVAFNKLRQQLGLPEKELQLPSLKFISTHYISSFFKPEKVNQIDKLKIPETFKRDVKKHI